MVRGRLAVGALLAAAATVAPGLALAASQPGPDRLSVELDARVEHDTDLPGLSSAEAKVRGVYLEDTVYTPSLNVNINLPVSRQTFFFKGYAGYVYHENNTFLDSGRVNLDAGVNSRVGLCNVTAEGNYQRSQSSFEDVVLAPTITNILEVTHLGVNGACGRKTGLGVTGEITQDWANNNQTLLRPQDYEQTVYAAGVTYTRPGLGMLTLFGRHQRTDYVHRPNTPGQTQGYDLNAGGVTFDRRLGARIEGNVTVAYTKVSTDNSAGTLTPTADFSGLTYSANLSFRPSHRLSFDGLFEHDVTPSNRFGNSYDIGSRYRVSSTYDLGTRITAKLAAEQHDVDSKGSQTFVGNLTNSRMRTISGSLSYRQSRRLSVTLDAAQEERRTNDARYNYDNTRVGLSAGVSY